jgi:hypothetical protein
MALAPLASVTDLQARGVDLSDPVLASTKLDEATDAIRNAAGVPISQATSTVKIPGVDGKWLDLPGQPVTAVSSVLLDGEAVTDYKFIGGRLWRWCGWQTYCHEPSEVTVTMTHGYTTVPADIVGLVCDFAIAGMNNATSGSRAGLVGEAIDDYRAQFATGEDAQASVMEIPERTRLMLRARFGGGAVVVTSA